MLATAEKWLAARRLTDVPSMVDKLELGNTPEVYETRLDVDFTKRRDDFTEAA
jgi:hypothetical protein